MIGRDGPARLEAIERGQGMSELKMILSKGMMWLPKEHSN